MNRLTDPNRYVIIALLAVAVAFLYWHDGRSGPRVADPNIRSGVIESVLSTSDAVSGPGGRTVREQSLRMRLDSGAVVTVLNDVIPLEEGDRAWVVVAAEGTDAEAYYLIQPRRTGGLLWVVILFVVLVLIVAGVHGARALVGMVASLAIVLGFLIPRILAGADPVLVGLISAAMILLVTFYASHGLNRKSFAALVGVVGSLAIVALLAQLSVHDLSLTGFGSEEVLYLTLESEQELNLIGLLIAGIIIAAIGVLDDVSITQASTVWELASAGKHLRGRTLFSRAMVVGRDHIAAVINTLVLAYVGAALPLILLLQLTRFPISFILSGDVLAEEIVLTLLSSMGLVLAIPLTTAVAVFLVRHLNEGT